MSTIIWRIYEKMNHIAIESVFVKVWYLDQKHHHKSKFLGPIPDMLSQSLWGKDSVICALTNHPGDWDRENHHCRWYQLESNNRK